MEDPRLTAYRFLVSAGVPPVSPAALPPGASPLASELGHGVIRHCLRLDWIIERTSGRRKASIDPRVLTILRLGVYQLLFIPKIPPYAAVSATVELAKRYSPKAGGFVNGVLRKIGPEAGELPRPADIRDSVRWLATLYSFPLWMVKRWERRFGGEEAEKLLAAMNTFPSLDLRVNLLRADPVTVAGDLRRAGGEVSAGTFSPAALHLRALRRLTALTLFTEGKVYIQDESSQLAALALSPRRGERVLDTCTGVGGKATHLAEIAGDRGEITAVDPDAERLVRLRENTERLGLSSITPLQEDILAPSFSPGKTFDRVLVDAPCSGLGIIRRHPEMKWVKRPSDPPRFARLQLRLLEKAAQFLAPGGQLAYSTCTTEPEENEEVVRRFIRRRPRFRVVPPPARRIRNLPELLTPEGFIATFPHRHGMNGSFTALLQSDVSGR